MSQLQQEFHEDGTPRRKYELEEREESRAGLFTAMGFALASGLLLMRNFLFGEPADARTSTDAAPARPAGGAPQESETSALSSDSTKEEEDEPKNGPGEGESATLPNVMISSSTTPVRVYDSGLPSVRRSSTLPAANNDNEQLYGAAQGKGIDLSPLASSFGTDWSGFSGRSPARDGASSRDDDNAPPPPRTNRVPVVTGPVLLAALPMNQSALIAVADLLGNVSDPDGDALHITGLKASSGQLIARGDGTYAFMPALGDTTSVIFTYEVSDGATSVAHVAYLDLLPITPVPILGTADDDTLLGTPSADIIDGLDGDDRILGREGDDLIYGGAGNDTLLGGDGNDVIHGGGGNDVIYGGAGNDRLFGGEGNDILLGEAGNDTLFGETGNDHLFGGSGTDALFGGEGNDVLDGGTGDDRAFGEDGDDIILVSAGDGDDHYDGGAGTDTYDASAVQEDMTIDLEAGQASGSSTGDDALSGIENVIGGSGDDVIIANDETNELSGGAGNDVFVFRSSAALGYGPGHRDRILDFEVGDRIDLDDISDEFEDAVEDHFEDQDIRKFVLIEQQEEFSRPGQIRFKYDQIDGAPVTVIQGNIDHDAEVEFELELAGTYTIRSEHFQS